MVEIWLNRPDGFDLSGYSFSISFLISATFTVYQDFVFYKSGVYSHVTGGVVGAHAIKMLGFVSVFLFCFSLFECHSFNLMLQSLHHTHINNSLHLAR